MMKRRGAVTATAVALTLAAGYGGAVPTAGQPAYPSPGPAPPVTETTLDDRYGVHQHAVQAALQVARGAGDHRRAATLASFTGRDLLQFDARGAGRAVEVIGDLATADRIAVVVPGAHTTLETFDREHGPGGGARALVAQARSLDPSTRVAAVAWLDYRAPQGLSLASVTDRRARDGAAALRATVAELRAANRDAPVSLLCHSYGSVVCAHAAASRTVADVVLYGSPGVGAASVDELDLPARVWAGRAAGDWIRFVPALQMGSVGFGVDPVSPEFGARPFPAGAGGHSDYHRPGGLALCSLARIVLGAGNADPQCSAARPVVGARSG